MIQRVFIIHRWGGHSEEGWFPWIKNKLRNKGFYVEIPNMPESDTPIIKTWLNFLSKKVVTPNESTFFIGHSIGCQTIIRYLQYLKEDQKVGGLILVAPWTNLTSYESEEEKIIAKPWIETPISWNNVLSHTKKIISIFSDNDPFVSLNEINVFKKNLKSKIIIEKNKGHFSGADNIKELPVVLEELLKILK